MARKITDFDGAVIAPSGLDPYGNIKDSPSGTTVNNKSNSDLQVFFQRLMDDWGITPNSLPENTTNGFQLMQALHKAINGGISALAAYFGCPVGNYVPLVFAGLVTTGSPTHNVSAGYFFYNGLLYYFPGGSYSSITIGYTIYLQLSTLDGMPVASLVQLVNTTPDNASQVQLANITRPDNINGTIIAATGLYSTGSTGTYIDSLTLPIKIKRTGSIVRIVGQTNNTSGGSSGIHVDDPFLILPVGYRPVTTKYCTIMGDLTVAYTFTQNYKPPVQIGTSGQITILGSKGYFTDNEAYFDISFDLNF